MNHADVLREGVLLVLVPHMDDEALACGGTIALHSDASRVHVLFATDGARSPSYPFPRRGAPGGLADTREAEAREAAAALSVPDANLRFARLPDGRLASSGAELEAHVTGALEEVGPAAVLAPFRYDRHRDHVALNRAAHRVLARLDDPPALLEYFVYWRWRSLPGGDLRRFVRADRVVSIGIDAVADVKRAALACHASQVTVRFPWQARPVVPPASVDAACRGPEAFYSARPGEPARAALARLRAWIPVAHRLEPPAKRIKDALAAPFRSRAEAS